MKFCKTDDGTFTKYYSDYQIKKTEMGRACNTYGVKERCVRVFGGEPEGRKTLGRPRLRLEDNIKIHLLGVGGGHELDRSGSA